MDFRLIEKLRRKRDQEWEMAGLARQDGDRKAEKAHTDKARAVSAEIAQLLHDAPPELEPLPAWVEEEFKAWADSNGVFGLGKAGAWVGWCGLARLLQARGEL